MSLEPKKALEAAFAARQSGNLAEAEAILLQLLSVRPQLTEAQMALGIVLMESGRPTEAVPVLQQIMSREPGCFPAANWLAVILTDLGKPEEALPHALQALKLRPKDLGAQVSMGRTLFSLGRYGDSVACFDRAIGIAPNDASYYYYKGCALEKMYRDDEAVVAFRAAVKISPTPSLLAQLADTEMTLGHSDEAMSAAERALKSEPNLGSALMIVARCLTEKGRETEADAYWQAALSHVEDPVPVQLTRSYAWMGAGRFEAATEELRKVIEAKPRHPDAYFSLIMANRITEADRPLLNALNQLIAGDVLAGESRMLAYYAAGKAHDNLGEYEQAVRSYNDANRLKRRLAFNDVPFDRREFESQVTEKIRIFTPTLFKETSNLGAPTDMPVLVVGMMRSGTTLVDQILTSHPDIGGAGEQSFWMAEQMRLVDLAKGKIAYDLIRPTAEKYVALLSRLAPGCRRVVDKNPANVLLAGMIHMCLPNARIILTRRHPVDTAVSIWMTPVRTTAPFFADREAIVFAYKQYLRAVENLREVLPADRFLEVDYEEVITDRETQTRRMLDFLGVEWNDACLRPEDNVRSVRTPSFWQVRQPVYTSSIGRWKRYEPWLGVFKELMPATELRESEH